MITIYKITHRVSGKSYIGVTSRTVHERWMEHRNYKDDTYFQRAIRKYGAGAFDKCVVWVANDALEAADRERYFIEYYHTLKPGGYNTTTGGDVGARHTQETRLKIAEASKNISGETRAKRVAKAIGRRHSKETIAKMTGRKLAPERIAAMRGKVVSKETREKLSVLCSGWSHTDDARAKIAAAMKNRYFSPEHRAKIKDGQTRRWDRERAELSAMWGT
jgi:group I intron endonuclease